jgi:dienelactone hydrolase
MRRSVRATMAVLVGVVLGLSLMVPGSLRALSLVARASDMQGGWVESLARWQTGPFRVSELTLPSRHGPLRARVYRPTQPRGHALVLTSGVHADGIDEPRLVKLASDLAAGGQVVVTPEPPELLRYQLSPRISDIIEDTALWLSARPELAPGGKVGLMGISFSGGLSIVAAGRPSLRERVAYVLALGGHGELTRVLSFLCTGVQPDGQRRTPHDYGLVVLLLNVADRLVPAEQVAPLGEAIRTFLRASHVAQVDPQRAQETFETARRMQARLPEPAATLMKSVNSRDVASLGPLLLPHVRALASDAALSPERSPAPSAPVYLLHGEDDSVIPAIESALLAEHLRPHTAVHHLATPVISHAEADREVSPVELWRLVAFWSKLLDE